jgi:hypothetical protein
MGSKKKTTTTSSQTNTAAPPSWTMPGIQAAAGAVTDALGQVQALPAYTGPFVARPDQGLVDAAVGGYTGAAGAVPGAVGTVQQGIDNVLGRSRQARMTSALPMIRQRPFVLLPTPSSSS